MPKVNVNAFGVVNLKFATSAFNSTSFSIINRQYSMAYASFRRIAPGGLKRGARLEFGPPSADYFAV